MKVAESQHTVTTYSWFNDKEHPIWGLLKTLISTAGIALLLSFTASDFDGGEVKTVAGSFILNMILEGFNVKKKFL